MSDVYDGLEHFSRGEFEPHADEMKPVFLVKLDKARSIAGIPFHLKSSFREGDDKSHGRGYAGDV